jgi:ketosteroid isomerase-like protein
VSEGPNDLTRLRQWLDAYGEAWAAGDPERLLQLFSPDAAYHETPFEPPMVGAEAIRRYWIEGARDGQSDVVFAAEPICVAGPVGWAHWRATFQRVQSGRQVELDGILSTRLDELGRCVEFREWWHRRED